MEFRMDCAGISITTMKQFWENKSVFVNGSHGAKNLSYEVCYWDSRDKDSGFIGYFVGF